MTLLITGRGDGPGGPGTGGGGTATLSGARVGAIRGGGGYTGTSIVQTVVPIEPGSPLEFSINGVDADVMPMFNDIVTGQPDTVRLAAPVDNPSGDYSIGGVSTGSALLSIVQAAGTPATASLKELDMSNLRVDLKLEHHTGSYVARPFAAGDTSVLRTETRRTGRYLRQTRTLCAFRKDDATAPFGRDESCMLVEVIRTSRSDHRVEMLDLVVMNAAWSSSEDPYIENPQCDGNVHFEQIRLSEIAPGDDVVLFQERPTTHARQESGTGVKTVDLVSPLPGAQELHKIGAGSYFVRRIALYRAGEVTEAIAKDIVDRRDFVWAEGGIGYCQGGWADYAHVPKFLDLPTITPGRSQMDALIDYGETYEANVRAYVADGVIIGRGVVQSGWQKPDGLRGPTDAGEGFLDLMHIEAPSPGFFAAKMLQGDGIMERHHLAVVNLDTNQEARITDYSESSPEGKLPYSYSGVGVLSDYPNMHLKTASTADPEALAPTDLPWNSLPSGYTAPHAQVAYQDQGNNDWGPFSTTHSGRLLGVLKSMLYAIDDPAAEMGLRFQGLLANAAWYHREIDFTGPLTRSNYYAEETGLHTIVADVLPSLPTNRGYWPNYRANTSRACAHAVATVTTLYHISDSALRDELDGNGDDDFNFFVLFGKVVDHVTSGNGMFSSDGRSSVDSHQGTEPDFATRLGAIPAGPTRHTTDEAWPSGHVFHQAYFAQSFSPLRRLLDRNPAHSALLDRLLKQPDILEDAMEVHRPDGQAWFPKDLHASVGTAFHNNPELTEAQARAGDGIWFGPVELGDPSSPNLTGETYRKPWSVVAQIPGYRERFGDFGGCLRIAKRQFGTPSSLSDEQLFAHIWSMAGEAYDDDGTFKFMVLNLVGLLQSLGYAHP